MFRSIASRVSIIVLFALVLGYFNLPSSLQTVPGTPDSFKSASINLGLDLQGGSQLDYKIDLRKVPQSDRKQIVDGVLGVINKRVNSLGVSEPNIYTSSIGDEQHLIVELAGIKDLNEAKKVVGKTIQLEFKEKREKEDPAHVENVRKNADSVLKKILSGAQFEVIGQEEAQAKPESVKFVEKEWQFVSGLGTGPLRNAVTQSRPNTVFSKLVEGSDGYTYENGQLVEQKGLFIIKAVGNRTTTSLPLNEKSLMASHILVSYKDAEKAGESITRTKEEAKARAQELLAKLKKGANFEDTAKESSDEPGVKDSLGKLSEPVKQGGNYVPSFTEGALKLTKPNELSEVVESPFGFHIIRADDLNQVKYSQIFFSTLSDPWQDTGLTGLQFERADVTFDNLLRPIVNIQFDADGAALFEKITERNINKPIAIFVGGTLISAPNVNEKIAGGKAIITGQGTVDEAQELARDLNTGAIPAPIVLSGQYTIGATLGQEALNRSVNAGIIGVVILALFMVLYYRLPGFVALLALGMYTIIMLFLIKSELPVALSLVIALVVFGAVVSKILKSRDGGWEKFIGFILACFVLFFVTFLLSNAITLTLAGIAGVILSIGMAVDANILIFERMKEELRAGRPLSAAIDVGFDRAWSSIRDSNFSSLITCAILFYFGTSIIQGFAFNLAAGILVSMFTAITVTKTLLTAFMKTSLSQRLGLWGVPAAESGHVLAEKKNLRIIEKTKLWFSISGVVIGVSLIAIIGYGLKLGLDFKGGTLLDLQFEKPVTVENIKKELATIEQITNAGRASESEKTADTQASGAALQSATEPVELANARVVSAGENHFIINAGHIDSPVHEKILENFEKAFGPLTENRYTTIGPVVGSTLKQKALIAVVVAMVMIILYIAFAFRKIPRHLSPWKFGICAIVALLHDVIIPIGLFSVLKLEVDALFITGILTVLGFSVHDTIVVFDRMRENLKYQGKDESFSHLANRSMTQTIARSINTSLTVLITLVSLLVFGSPTIFNFILVLVVGISVGTYSSIFIASPLLVLWQNKEKKASM